MNVAILLSAAERTVPIIDLDGTVFVQLAIFLALLFVLWPLLFRPYLKVREDRERGITGAKADAEAMDQKAQALIADYEQRLQKTRQRGAEERQRLRSEGLAHEREVLGQARAGTEAEIAAARAKAQLQEQAARQALLAEATTIGRQIAARVLGRPA